MSRAARAKRRSPRLVFDTMLLLRALLLNDASARRLRQAWQQGSCLPLIGASQAHELLRALAYPPLKLDEAQRHELLADFLPYAEVVEEGQVMPGRKPQQAALRLLAAPGARAEGLISDCTQLRRAFAASLSRSESAQCRLLGSAEFLAGL